ncbi:flavin reductase family protein [Sporosarcina sp. FSL W7-1349]|uniref:flavin reductase family protein n=1 Tax=Sporosarcina sp. FSL W7-1349 TaxID=2921561 RepID=UPI0030FB5F2E
MDPREFRNCMGRFATGVTVVTCSTENGNHGITANSFTSVSLDPPLVLVSIDRKTKAFHHMKDNSFTVNILTSSQEEVALHFAGRPQEMEPIEWVNGEHAVRLSESLAYIECTPWAEYDGGDHILYVGLVRNFQYTDADALTYYAGKFGSSAAQNATV